MIPRVASSIVFFALLLFGLYYPAPWANHVILAAVVWGTLAGTREYYHLARRLKLRPSPWPGYVGALAFLADAYFFEFHNFVYIFIAVFWVVFLTQVFLKRLDGSVANTACSLFGCIYVALPLAIVLDIFRHATVNWDFHDARSGGNLVLFLILSTWATDIGGYCFGKPFGRHKMSPVLSPNKSWEGLAGGAVLAVLAGGLLWRLWPGMAGTLGLAEALCLPVLFTVVGTVGDLAESAFKRDAGVKDSGHTFTGHGGMLDILDSLLLCAPVFYLYIRIVHERVLIP
jgi:phosphatidate cytidylyltransferase